MTSGRRTDRLRWPLPPRTVALTTAGVGNALPARRTAESEDHMPTNELSARVKEPMTCQSWLVESLPSTYSSTQSFASGTTDLTTNHALPATADPAVRNAKLVLVSGSAAAGLYKNEPGWL